MTDTSTPLAESDDRTLLQQHIAGDPDAFAVLVARHQDRMWAVALRTVGNPEEAADALQDAMIKAFRSADRFRGDSAVTTWLHRIVVNACLDALRRKKARPAVPLDDGERSAVLAQTPSDDSAVRREQRLDVLDALQQLPPDQRAAVVLVDMEGYSVAETAQLLDCPPGTIKSRCSRARTSLAALLHPWRNQPDVDDVPSTGTHLRDPQSEPGGDPRG